MRIARPRDSSGVLVLLVLLLAGCAASGAGTVGTAPTATPLPPATSTAGGSPSDVNCPPAFAPAFSSALTIQGISVPLPLPPLTRVGPTASSASGFVIVDLCSGGTTASVVAFLGAATAQSGWPPCENG